MMNIEKLPFVVAGAYLSISKDAMQQGNGMWIRSLIRPEWGTGRKKVSDHMFRISPLDKNGRYTQFEIEYEVGYLKFKTKEGSITVNFCGAHELNFELDNMGMVLEHDCDDNKAVNIDFSNKNFSCFFPVTFFDATIKCDNATLEYDNGTRRIYVLPTKEKSSFIFSSWNNNLKQPTNEFAFKTKEDAMLSFENFVRPFEVSNETEKNALYILWGSIYSKCGKLPYKVNAISINNMNLIWSWDNCFNALCVAKTDEELAWNDILIFLDRLCEDGRIIDAMNPSIDVNWFVKPPVQGYFIGKMLESGFHLSRARLVDVYLKLSKWTNWWEKNKTTDGLFFYAHPFDSGWDNATCFDFGKNVVTPDLNAYLAIQFEILSKIAKELEFLDESIIWSEKSKKLINVLQDKLFVDGEFGVLSCDNVFHKTTALVKIMPIILENRLKQDVQNSLIKEISQENHFLTCCGIATECLDSKKYDSRVGDNVKPNPYWRGPIWTPPLYFIYSALKNLKEVETAKKISSRFIQTMENCGDFYEDYDALTGIGYDDTGYCWTSSVYLMLKEDEGKL